MSMLVDEIVAIGDYQSAGLPLKGRQPLGGLRNRPVRGSSAPFRSRDLGPVDEPGYFRWTKPGVSASRPRKVTAVSYRRVKRQTEGRETRRVASRRVAEISPFPAKRSHQSRGGVVHSKFRDPPREIIARRRPSRAVRSRVIVRREFPRSLSSQHETRDLSPRSSSNARDRSPRFPKRVSARRDIVQLCFAFLQCSFADNASVTRALRRAEELKSPR